MKERDLDPAVEAAFRKLSDAADRLETVRIRTERTAVADLVDEPTPVTEGVMFELAAMPQSSPELKTYATRVDNGECTWPEIERRAWPLPPEVTELKDSRYFTWLWSSPPPPPSPRGAATVGPTDWPDDYDGYPAPKSWLE
ncbi:hypothetical protein [Rhodococcus tibetensis]|uniref:Uncharacterized protein n=1 Tax=Rhodococcus tibetensis TaxID=2965064 RepID=A0ABT1Q683_9NOCA|nr:hypothetical protein [Rhodococcus sp. FXJ9.536]MCQ4117754.1 hypothetical protein [Rhodococcus sp. FXJ9.536]